MATKVIASVIPKTTIKSRNSLDEPVYMHSGQTYTLDMIPEGFESLLENESPLLTINHTVIEEEGEVSEDPSEDETTETDEGAVVEEDGSVTKKKKIIRKKKVAAE